MADSSRRLLLRLSVKLMLASAVAITIYVLFSSIQSTDESEPELSIAALRFQLPDTPQSNPQRIAWSGGNLILIVRNDSLLASLKQHEERLLDPHSLTAHQPAVIHNPERAIQPQLFLAFDRGTDMGCPLNWVPAGNREAPLQPWPGGFRDNCRGSWYDAAGRVFKGQEAQRNLDIPPYRLLEGGLLEIGVSGDNAAPAN